VPGLDTGLEVSAGLPCMLADAALHALLVAAFGAGEDSSVFLNVVDVKGMAGHFVTGRVGEVAQAVVFAFALGVGTLDEVVIAVDPVRLGSQRVLGKNGSNSLTAVLRSNDPLDVCVGDALKALDAPGGAGHVRHDLGVDVLGVAELAVVVVVDTLAFGGQCREGGIGLATAMALLAVRLHCGIKGGAVAIGSLGICLCTLDHGVCVTWRWTLGAD